MIKSNLWLELTSNLKTTGAFTFSSKGLIQKMLSNADLSQAKVIVELGGGNGCITQELITKLNKESILYVFEINPSFCESMKKMFDHPRVKIIQDSAENMSQYLEEEKVDYIFSSLPFTLLTKEVTDKILVQCKKSLSSNGFFIQICYSIFLKNLFKQYFSFVHATITFKNFPPAFVMVCK